MKEKREKKIKINNHVNTKEFYLVALVRPKFGVPSFEAMVMYLFPSHWGALI